MSKPGRSVGPYWMYGLHACGEALRNPERKVLRVCALKNREQELELPKTTEILAPEKLAALLPPHAVHQGIAVQVQPLEQLSLSELLFALESKATLVILDQVTDPQNVGAILRSCAAFGAAGVITPSDHSPPESGALAKAASGALDIIPWVRITNLASTIKELKKEGFWSIGLDGEAKDSIDKLPSYDRKALVLGAEGAGLRRLTRDCCDLIAKIPISSRMESLNVSTAAAVALYALR